MSDRLPGVFGFGQVLPDSSVPDDLVPPSTGFSESGPVGLDTLQFLHCAQCGQHRLVP